MRLLEILTNEKLPTSQCFLVTQFTSSLMVDIITPMFLTMSKAGGIGLAAPQVGIMKRIIIIDTAQEPNGWRGVMINPKILSKSEFVIKTQEGCLSFPGEFVWTSRPTTIGVTFQDMYGNEHSKVFNRLTAVCIQHEIDHLNSITMHQHKIQIKE